MKIAVKHDLVLRIEARPGRFVWDKQALLSAYPREAVSHEAAEEFRSAFVLGAERTPEQDLEFSVRRIVEIAQRALSPGINDPTTALYCIDRLGETFARLAQRDIPSALRVDENGRVRILTETAALEQLARPALLAVARYGSADSDVSEKLLETLDALIQVIPPGSAGGITKLREQLGTEQRQRRCTDKQGRSPANA
jgi:uncharacterized membrane protein